MDVILEEKKSFDYLLLELRMKLNRELFDKNVISADIFNQMQDLLIRKMACFDMEK